MKKTILTLSFLCSMLIAFILPNMEVSAAETLTLGTTEYGTISTGGEVKEYTFTTTKNDSFYTMVTKNVSINAYRYETRVYDSFGNRIWKEGGLGKNSSKTTVMKLNPNETYRVKCYASGDNDTGNFSFTVTEKVDDLPDTIAEAKTIRLGETVTHSLDGWDDVEWFKFTTSNRYSYYEVKCKNLSIDGYKFNFRVFDYNLQRLINKSGINKNDSATQYYRFEPGTTYYIKCCADDNKTGNYNFSITEITDDTYNEKENAQQVKINTTYTRKLEVPADVDYFKFTTGASENYTFTLNNIANSGYSLCGYIYSATEERMVAITDLNKGATKNAAVTLDRFTEYYLRIKQSRSSSGNYAFSISDGTIKGTDANMNPIVCDISGVTNPAYPAEKVIGREVVAGGTQDAPANMKLDTITHGEIVTAKQAYWYTFTTTANNSFYKLTAKNVNIDAYRFECRVYDVNSNQIWKAGGLGYSSSTSGIIKLEPNSKYYVKCYATGNNDLGKFSVKVEEIIDDLGDEKADAKKVKVEEDVLHNANAQGDVDWFTFTTTANDSFYKIYTKNYSILGYKYNFYVYNEYDEVITKSTGINYGDTATKYIKLEPSTTYYVKCSASDGYTGNYYFKISEIPDDVPDTKETALSLSVNKIYDRKINAAGDVDYFKFTVKEAGNYTFYSKNLSIDGYKQNALFTNEYDEQLAKISGQNYNTGKEKSVALTPGTYYVKATASDSKTGYYRIYLLKEGAQLQDEFVRTYPLTSIALNKTTTKLVKGKTEQLSVTYNPYYTTDKRTVTWISNNPAVATVVNGLVTAKAAGTATITANVNGKTARCTVTVVTEDQKKVQDNLGLTDEGAKELTDYINKNNVSMDVVLTTDNKITTQKSEDIAAATYNILSARATKTTKNSITLKWTNVRGADGYIVYGNKCGLANKYKKIKVLGKNAKSFTQKKLKKGTFYKYLVIAYKVIDGQKITIEASKTIHAVTTGGKYGNAKAVKVNKTKVTLKAKKSFTIKASEVKKDKTLKKHRKISYESTNTKVATVNKKGKITARGKGKCTIYVYAQNGMFKKVNVTVK